MLWGEPGCWRLEAVGESEEGISAGGEGVAGGFARLAGNELGLAESAVHENRVPPRMNGNRLDQVKLTNATPEFAEKPCPEWAAPKMALAVTRLVQRAAFLERKPENPL